MLALNTSYDHTLPPVYSTQRAFLRKSVCNDPATVAWIVDGGKCCSPGPSFNCFFSERGIKSARMTSPGSTDTAVVIVYLAQLRCLCFTY